MGKKSKKEANKELAEEKPTESKKLSASKSKERKPRTSKTGRPSIAHAPTSRRSGEPSDEEIRLRAYFIAERRMQLRLEGDSTHDWIEARRQLIEERLGNGLH